MTLAALLSKLDTAGVLLALNETGDGLKLGGRGQPPVALIEEVRAAKPALLAHLRGEVRLRTYPDLAALASQPGHCGSCARFEPDPNLFYLGTCQAPPEDWWPIPPLAVHPAHKCDARAGRAYKTAP